MEAEIGSRDLGGTSHDNQPVPPSGSLCVVGLAGQADHA
jgi:hypothetical protein